MMRHDEGVADCNNDYKQDERVEEVSVSEEEQEGTRDQGQHKYSNCLWLWKY